MSANQDLLPIAAANLVSTLQNTEDGTFGEGIKYRHGFPKQVRFDAQRGLFNEKGEINLSKAGEEFQIIPISYRIFKDEILGMKPTTWCEIFFLNAKKQVCAVLFHGYSVENLNRLASEMFYDDCNLTDITLIVKPILKVSKQTDADGKANKYYIAEFDYKPLTSEQREANKLLGEMFPFYREETFTPAVTMLEESNYKNPFWEDVKEQREAQKLLGSSEAAQIAPVTESAGTEGKDEKTAAKAA